MKDVNAVRDAHLAGGDPFAAANDSVSENSRQWPCTSGIQSCM